jgi:hypothetical protein
LLAGFYILQKNHLHKSGWKKSVTRGLPVNGDGNEIPWFTFGAIYFLNDRLQKEHAVFEYGSGHSTIWFSSRVKQIISVEHDETWYEQMKEPFRKYHNIEYLLKDLGSSGYQKEILNYANAFDLIVLDGRQRVECCLNCLPALKKDGIIIWDNSDRVKYSEGYQFLKENGFRRLDFFGMGPISAHSWCTSVFYREQNCLAI